MCLELVNELPKETLSAVASRFSQKDTQDNTTSSTQGP